MEKTLEPEESLFAGNIIFVKQTTSSKACRASHREENSLATSRTWPPPEKSGELTHGESVVRYRRLGPLQSRILDFRGQPRM